MINPGLLAAVVAAPEDDQVRLVYADWLDDQGAHARAEFIRVQIALARLPLPAHEPPHGQHTGGPRCRHRLYEKCVDCRDFCLREQELFADVLSDLLEGLPGGRGNVYKVCATVCSLDGRTYCFRRGFLDEVICRVPQWADDGPALACGHPVTSLTLADVRVVYAWPYGANGRHWRWDLCFTETFGVRDVAYFSSEQEARVSANAYALAWAKYRDDPQEIGYAT